MIGPRPCPNRPLPCPPAPAGRSRLPPPLTLWAGLAAAVALGVGAGGSGGCAGRGPTRELTLRRVVLYQNGVGYFERSGLLRGDRLRLTLRSHEVGDVLKSLMVLDQEPGQALGRGRQRAVSVVLPQPGRDPSAGKDKAGDDLTAVDILLSEGGTHQLTVAYAVPTPVWKAAYRVVLPEAPAAAADSSRGTTPTQGLLQGWALIDNASGESWSRVALTLATGAPLTFALDMRTPQFVARPDLTGQLIRPVATGAIFAEQADSSLDTDRDGIPDVNDKCPSEPETYNGIQDEDGCPDRGRVLVTSTRIEILERLYFARGSAEIKPAAAPLLDAVAATLKGHPQLQLISVDGHASDEEQKGYELAERRAAAVRRALVERGVQAERLTSRGYGATRPLSSARDEASRERNRRTEFMILKNADGDERGGESARPAGGITASAAAQSAKPGQAPRDVAGTTHYVLSDPVTIPRGSSTMVSVINQLGQLGQHGQPGQHDQQGQQDQAAGAVEDIYLYRPDAAVPGSADHPLRAARLVPPSPLEAGPVAVFAGGTFVGEGLIGRLRAGEAAFVPYALDSSTTVRTSVQEQPQPVRLVSLRQGVATVEDVAVRGARYEIAVGKSPPPRLFLRHGRRAGYTPQTSELPPGTESNDDALLLPVPLQAGKTSVLTVEERKQVRRQVSLSAEGESLEPYLERTKLPAELVARLRELAKLSTERAKLAEGSEHLREQLADLTQRSDELRESLRTVEKMASAAALARELVGKLQDASQKSEAISKQLVARSEAMAAASARYTELLRDLRLDEPAAP